MNNNKLTNITYRLPRSCPLGGPMEKGSFTITNLTDDQMVFLLKALENGEIFNEEKQDDNRVEIEKEEKPAAKKRASKKKASKKKATRRKKAPPKVEEPEEEEDEDEEDEDLLEGEVVEIDDDEDEDDIDTSLTAKGFLDSLSDDERDSVSLTAKAAVARYPKMDQDGFVDFCDQVAEAGHVKMKRFLSKRGAENKLRGAFVGLK